MFKVQDFAHSKEVFLLEPTPDGTLLKTTPVPENLENYYSKDSYISHKNEFSSFSEKLYLMAKKFQLRKKATILERHLFGPKKILDFGAGTGALVSYLKNNNWHALGVEPNEMARAVALQNNCVLHPSLEAIPKQEFNIISLWHVLEHLPDYTQSIRDLLGKLSPGGHLILALPNFNSWDAKHYNEYWAAYDVPRHLWHFSQSAVKQLAIENRLSLQKTYPMPLDAFYVSLVSERFKKNPLALPAAFFKGCYSNVHARFTGEYSSLIYVLKKLE